MRSRFLGSVDVTEFRTVEAYSIIIIIIIILLIIIIITKEEKTVWKSKACWEVMIILRVLERRSFEVRGPETESHS